MSKAKNWGGRAAPPKPPVSDGTSPHFRRGVWGGRLVAPGLLFLAALAPAQAATLRNFRMLQTDTVRLSDLFDGITVADRVLGTAPAPGARIMVQAPQLAAIARDFNVDWRPVSGAEQAVLQRDAASFPQDEAIALLRPRLIAAGASPDAGISLADYQPPMMPRGAQKRAELDDVSYDAATGRFTASLTVTARDAPPNTVRLSGQAIAMVDAVELTQPLAAGTVLTQDRVHATRIPASSLRGTAAVTEGGVLGLALRHNVGAGQPLVMGDLTHPILVARNATVRMALSAGAIALSAEGIALEDGALGAHIRVQNPTSRAVVLAEITGAGEVRVMAGHAPIQVAAQ